jgi:hypothetical protein
MSLTIDFSLDELTCDKSLTRVVSALIIQLNCVRVMMLRKSHGLTKVIGPSWSRAVSCTMKPDRIIIRRRSFPCFATTSLLIMGISRSGPVGTKCPNRRRVPGRVLSSIRFAEQDEVSSEQVSWEEWIGNDDTRRSYFVSQ